MGTCTAPHLHSRDSAVCGRLRLVWTCMTRRLGAEGSADAAAQPLRTTPHIPFSAHALSPLSLLHSSLTCLLPCLGYSLRSRMTLLPVRVNILVVGVWMDWPLAWRPT